MYVFIPYAHLHLGNVSLIYMCLCICVYMYICVQMHILSKTYTDYLGACSGRRQWHPTPVLLPGKSNGQRSLVGYSPWGCKEMDMTEWLHFHFLLKVSHYFSREKIIIMTPRNWKLNVTKLYKDWAKYYWLEHVVTCRYLVTLNKILPGLTLKTEMLSYIKTTTLEQLRYKNLR